jgi:hypothetical protein
VQEAGRAGRESGPDGVQSGGNVAR